MKYFFSDREKERFYEDQKFRVEALKRILPDTSWYGETHHDDCSVNNIETLELLWEVFKDELLENAFVPEGNRGNGSYEEIAKAKQSLLKLIFSDLFDSNSILNMVIEYFEKYFEVFDDEIKAKLKEIIQEESHEED